MLQTCAHTDEDVQRNWRSNYAEAQTLSPHTHTHTHTHIRASHMDMQACQHITTCCSVSSSAPICQTDGQFWRGKSHRRERSQINGRVGKQRERGNGRWPMQTEKVRRAEGKWRWKSKEYRHQTWTQDKTLGKKTVSVTYNEWGWRRVKGRVSKWELCSFVHKRYKCARVCRRERYQKGGEKWAGEGGGTWEREEGEKGT